MSTKTQDRVAHLVGLFIAQALLLPLGGWALIAALRHPALPHPSGSRVELLDLCSPSGPRVLCEVRRGPKLPQTSRHLRTLL